MPTGNDPNGMRVVVAFLDKSRDRGLVYEFKPYGDGFTLHPTDDSRKERGRYINFTTIKAVYFVKTLEGNRNHKEKKTQLPPVYRQGRKVQIHFPDGEQYMGTTEGFNPQRVGFFFYPGDPQSNNLEVFIVTSNADEIRIIGAGENGTDKVHQPRLEGGIFLPEMRLKAVQRIIKGEALEVVAKELSIPAAKLVEWRAKYYSGGPAALGVLPAGAAAPAKPPEPQKPGAIAPGSRSGTGAPTGQGGPPKPGGPPPGHKPYRP